MELDPQERTIGVRGFAESQLSFAFDAYLASEKRLALDHDTQVVLVAVDSLAALRAAYPNYYLDAVEFVTAMRRALEI